MFINFLLIIELGKLIPNAINAKNMGRIFHEISSLINIILNIILVIIAIINLEILYIFLVADCPFLPPYIIDIIVPTF